MELKNQPSSETPDPSGKTEENHFDLYKHIKENIKNAGLSCQDPISSQSVYCLDCRLSTCPNCINFNSHNGHNLINKSPYYQNSQSLINEQFVDLENIFNMNPEYLDVNKSRGEFKILVENEINGLISSLNQIKDVKMQEIDALFAESDNCVSNLKKQVSSTKKNIFDFFKEQKAFFNIDLEGSNDVNEIEAEGVENVGDTIKNMDFCNMVFLLNYDMQNIAKERNKKIKAILLSIKEICGNYQNFIKERVVIVQEAIEKLKEPFNENFDYTLLSQEHYKEINTKLEKYKDQIKNIRQSIFDSVKKFGNLEEIEKSNSIQESKQRQNIEYILQSDKLETTNKVYQGALRGFKPKMRHFNGNGTKRLMTEDSRVEKSHISLISPPVKYKSPNEINLNNATLQKHFVYLTLGLIRKEFHQGKKGGVEALFDEELDEDFDVAKPIPGTNEMQVYDKRTRTLVKKKVQLDKNQHKYNYFLNGCRCVLIKDRLYITGGRDKANKESNVCYVYYIRTNELKVIPEMINARAYHSVLFVDSYKSLIAIGGENNHTCELYDMYNIKWRSLPNLNYPRAHTCLYVDRLTNILYSCFGLTGNISNARNYTDIMECLELKKVSFGWAKVEYKNRTELNFKNGLCRIFPLNEEKLLIYGASPLRESKKKGAIFIISKSEIVKIDNNTFNFMRLQAKQSNKLNKIISSLA